ncbi:MAG: hypothetical protein BGN97_09950 [Microbacterium sp. 69-10]|uniref:sulfate permease n=1 Tax=Microbacterium sp. 69-10 TaxID=1895783 RepID=UPI00096135DF|nr:sulfate permease [Microbacterium sp. 69-10]OJU41488.1 MAG: hypothetical protein BGN97_09950 [Microbacterium sp. 69-10]
MFRLIWILSVHVRNALHRYAPTNILSDAIRSERLRPVWALGAMLLAVPYFLAAYLCTTVIDGGGPRALYVLVVLFIWNAMKMLWIGPVTIIVQIRTRISEAILQQKAGK